MERRHTREELQTRGDRLRGVGGRSIDGAVGGEVVDVESEGALRPTGVGEGVEAVDELLVDGDWFGLGSRLLLSVVLMAAADERRAAQGHHSAENDGVECDN